MEKISKKQTQQIIIQAHRLDGSLKTPLKTIEHLGYVQIDSISVVERAHHHVFWSRNESYRPEDLTKLVSKKKVFEYWSHAASYLPMRDFKHSLYIKEKFKGRANAWSSCDPKIGKKVLERVKKEGPLRAKDFEQSKKGSNGWWNFKPAKKALELLFLEGDLVIKERKGFQKVFDLPERVIPGFESMSTPTEIEFIHYLIEQSIRGSGIVTVNEIVHLQKKSFKDKVQKELDQLVEDRKLQALQIEGVRGIYYTKAKHLKTSSWDNKRISILSPFDNLTIHRGRLKNIFDYDYQIECYMPALKRKYGYFSLPILKGDQFIGRVDLKAERKEGLLKIQNLHAEKSTSISRLRSEIKVSLKSFADFNSCQKTK